MLSTIFPLVSSVFCSMFPWRIKAPQRAADEPYGEASFRTSLSVPFHCPSSRKAALKGRLFPERDYFCTGKAIYACFLPFGKVARIFPLHLPVVLERRRFWGGVSELEGHLPVLFWKFQNRWSFWRLRVRFGAATCKCWITRSQETLC